MEGLAIVYGVCLAADRGADGAAAGAVRRWRRDLPTGWGRRVTGTVIGGLSAMMGIGGGSFGGMMMTLCGRPIHQAVATASGFGVAIGAAATLGFVVFGWDAAGRPPLSLGYVNVPGAIVMAVLTTAVAPWGAKLAHRLDRRVAAQGVRRLSAGDGGVGGGEGGLRAGQGSGNRQQERLRSTASSACSPDPRLCP